MPSRSPVPAATSPQLSLFDLPAGPADEAPTALRSADLAPAGPPRPARAPADPRRPAMPPAKVPQVLEPGQGFWAHRHPQADRDIELAGCRVGYQLRRARRRSIGFVVGTDGLSVSAPRWVGQPDIDAALRAKADWILRKLRDQQERARRLAAARVEWRDGASLPFLGETVILVLDPRVTGAVLNTDAQALPGLPRLTLHLGLPQQAEATQIRDLVHGWLQRQARRIFEERCAHFAARLGVRMTRLSLSSAQTRWGSASADGSVRLNWRLVHFGLAMIDYVVAHELAHLREMNHSPAFWEVVRSVVPGYAQVRGELAQAVLPALD